MKKKIERKEKGFEYFSLAMIAFGGLGLEGVLAYWIEQMLYGHGINEFTLFETLLHWTSTCIIWLLVSFYVLYYSKKKLEFDLLQNKCKFSFLGIVSSTILLAFTMGMNYSEYGTLKICHEFINLGFLKFTFQHIYYLVETILFMFIIVYSQIAMEIWFKNTKIPYGGIIVGLTWGLVHWFTKGSLLIGLQGVVLGFLFGGIYLLLSRDIRKTYIVLALAFIL